MTKSEKAEVKTARDGPASKEGPESFDLRSHTITEERQRELLRLFPEARTEGEKVDFNRLRLALGDSVDVGKERYGLTWPGKAECFKAIQTPSLGTLLPAPKDSVNWDSAENLIIEGDNLEVLKLLQRAYLGKVKMIYIDPPYNTGNDFIYPDDYAESLQTYLEYTGQVDSRGKKFSTNADTEGRFHSKWLNMMYPRLYLARDLLTEDGAILVSIDDHEVHNLRLLMNEVFGEENFVAEIVWEGTVKNDSKFVSISHDYILCYARNREHLRVNDKIWRTRKRGIDDIYTKVEELRKAHREDFQQINDDLASWYASLDKNNPAWRHRHYKKVDERGVYFPGAISWPGGSGPKYEIRHPRTGRPVKVPSPGWRFGEAEMHRLIDDNRIDFGPDESTVPTVKRYLRETEDQVLPSVLYRDRRGAVQRLRKLLGGDLFDDPKDEEVLENFVEAISSSDDIVLDFFAGSGTTAQAVVGANATDGEKRRFVLVQLPEPTPEDSRARKAGYSTISDLCVERVRRVAQRVLDGPNGSPDTEVNGPSNEGFRVYKLAESNFKVWNSARPDKAGAIQQRLIDHIRHIREGCSEQDILTEILLKSGFPPTTSISEVSVGGKTAYKVDDNRLVICLDRHLTLDAIRAIADLRPERVVCLDEGFEGNDQLKVNAAQTFKTKGVTSFQTV